MALNYICFGLYIILVALPTSWSTKPKCGGTLSAESTAQYFETPNYPLPYPYDTTCKWIIEAPAGHVVQLTFEHFDIETMDDECDIDQVHIRNGVDENSPMLGKVLCGQKAPERVTGSGRNLLVILKSDAFSSEESSGFRAKYIAVPEESGTCVTNMCGGELTGDRSCIIQSPGYPIRYDSGLNCSWRISGWKPGHRVSVTFNELHLSGGNIYCKKNNLTFFNVDERNQASLAIGKAVCDLKRNHLQSATLVSDGPSMLIRLQTSLSSEDSFEIEKGFHIKFEIIDSDGSTVADAPVESTGNPTTVSTRTTESTTPSFAISKTYTITPHASASSETDLTTSTVSVTPTTSSLVLLSKIATTVPANANALPREKATTINEDTTRSDEGALAANTAAMSGLVIGLIAVMAVVILVIVLLIAYSHWKKRTSRITLRLRDEDTRSDATTLLSSLSSADSRELTDMSKKKDEKLITDITVNDHVDRNSNLYRL